MKLMIETEAIKNKLSQSEDRHNNPFVLISLLCHTQRVQTAGNQTETRISHQVIPRLCDFRHPPQSKTTLFVIL